MIQEDEYIIYLNQAKCAVTSTSKATFSQTRLNHEDWNVGEEDCYHHPQSALF